MQYRSSFEAGGKGTGVKATMAGTKPISTAPQDGRKVRIVWTDEDGQENEAPGQYRSLERLKALGGDSDESDARLVGFRRFHHTEEGDAPRLGVWRRPVQRRLKRLSWTSFRGLAYPKSLARKPASIMRREWQCRRFSTVTTTCSSGFGCASATASIGEGLRRGRHGRPYRRARARRGGLGGGHVRHLQFRPATSH